MSVQNGSVVTIAETWSNELRQAHTWHVGVRHDFVLRALPFGTPQLAVPMTAIPKRSRTCWAKDQMELK